MNNLVKGTGKVYTGINKAPVGLMPRSRYKNKLSLRKLNLVLRRKDYPRLESDL